MSFNANIPQPTDFISDSQSQILNNFASSNTSFARNHTAFNVVTNPGKHKFVEMVNSDPVGTPPVPGLIATEGTTYTKLVGGESQMFYTPGATGKEYQLSRTINAKFSTFANSTVYSTGFSGGWTFLPGGLLLQYGTLVTPASNIIVPFPVAYSNPVFSVTIQPASNSTSRFTTNVQGISQNDFTVVALNSSGSPTVLAINWMAIGK